MQVSVENTGKLERRMQVQVPAERVSKEIASRLKQISRTARLNGFRPGKAPLTVIRQQFGPQVHREVIGELMQSSFSEAVTQNQLAPAGSPRIEPQSITDFLKWKNRMAEYNRGALPEAAGVNATEWTKPKTSSLPWVVASVRPLLTLLFVPTPDADSPR